MVGSLPVTARYEQAGGGQTNRDFDYNAVDQKKNTVPFEYRISNKECRIMKFDKVLLLRHSSFLVRYSAVREDLLNQAVLILNETIQFSTQVFFSQGMPLALPGRLPYS